MAGERIGKTCEALFSVVLAEMKRQGKLRGNVFWNETPKGISVEPDFIIGQDLNHPDYVIMVTHSGSSKESNRKTWRNIGELCDR